MVQMITADDTCLEKAVLPRHSSPACTFGKTAGAMPVGSNMLHQRF